MVIKIGETEYEAAFNGFTPIIFSRCFTVQKPDASEKPRKPTIIYRPKDINESVGQLADSLQTYGVPAIAPLLEILYACIKTATPKFDVPFSDWVKALPAGTFDLQKGDGWAADVIKIVEDTFFPSASNGVAPKTAEKTRTAASEQS